MYKLLNFTSEKVYVEKDINAQWPGLKKNKLKKTNKLKKPPKP